MLLNTLRAITDFAVLMARLTTEEFDDEQRMVLIDQFMRLQWVDDVIHLIGRQEGPSVPLMPTLAASLAAARLMLVRA